MGYCCYLRYTWEVTGVISAPARSVSAAGLASVLAAVLAADVLDVRDLGGAVQLPALAILRGRRSCRRDVRVQGVEGRGLGDRVRNVQ